MSRITDLVFGAPKLTAGQERILESIPLLGTVEGSGFGYQDFATAEQHWLLVNMKPEITAQELSSAMRKIIDAAFKAGRECEK